MDDNVMCPTCGKVFSKKGIGYHIWKMHGAGIDFDPNRGYKDGTRQAWNKGLTKETDKSVLKYSEALTRKNHLLNKNWMMENCFKNGKINVLMPKQKALSVI